MFGRNKQPKHEHKFTQLVDVQHANFLHGGGDCTDLLVKCECGEIDVKTLNGHFDKEQIWASYGAEPDPDEIEAAANTTKNWIKDQT